MAPKFNSRMMIVSHEYDDDDDDDDGDGDVMTATWCRTSSNSRMILERKNRNTFPRSLRSADHHWSGKWARCANTPQSILLVSNQENVIESPIVRICQDPRMEKNCTIETTTRNASNSVNWPPDRQSAEAVVRGRASLGPTTDPSEGHGSTEVESPAA